MSVLEKEIEAKVVNWAKKAGFLTPKVKFAEVGYPDRLFLSPKGHTIFIEFKVPGAKPDPIQFYRIRSLTSRGIPAFWCDSALEAIRILQAALESTPVPGESDTPVPESGGGRVIPGPGFGKDLDRLGIASSSPPKELNQQGADSGSSAGGGAHMAERDEQVGGVRPADLRGDPRPEEEREAES